MAYRAKKARRFTGVRWVKDRHGQARYCYVQPLDGGKEIRIDGEHGSPEWERQYHRARGVRMPQVPQQPVSPAMAARLTFSEALEHYLRSIAFSNLAPATQRVRQSMLGSIARTWPDAIVGHLTKPQIVEMLDGTSPHQHRNYVKAIRSLLRHFELNDPTFGYIYPKPAESKGFKMWTWDAIVVFRATWPLGTLERTIFELLYWTCQRRADVCAMMWSHIVDVIGDDGTTFKAIAVRSQQKTKQSVTIPIDPELMDALDAWERSCTVRLNQLTHSRERLYGKHDYRNGDARREREADYILKSRWLFKLDPATYCQVMRSAILAAGLPVFERSRDNIFQGAFSGHGLRKAGMSAIAEGGGTHFDIMSISGHTSTRQVDWYVKEHEKLRAAVSAAKKRREVAEKREQRARADVIPIFQTRNKGGSV